jgi:hypothetical protein
LVRIERALGDGGVARLRDEAPELPDRDRPSVDPEGFDRDAVDGPLLGIERVGAH